MDAAEAGEDADGEYDDKEGREWIAGEARTRWFSATSPKVIVSVEYEAGAR